MEITRYKRRHWAVWNADGSLLCVCVYRRGANEVLRRLCVQEERNAYGEPPRPAESGYFVAFPTHLVDELLAFLPLDERPVYAEHFERIVGNLVWVRDDAENAVKTALEECAQKCVLPAGTLAAEVTEALLDFEDDALVTSVIEALTEAARRLVNARLIEGKPATQ